IQSHEVALAKLNCLPSNQARWRTGCKYGSRRSTSSRTQRFTLRTEASPSSSYYDSFHQRFTLRYGAPPSPSYHSSFHQRFTLHSRASPSSYYDSFQQRSVAKVEPVAAKVEPVAPVRQVPCHPSREHGLMKTSANKEEEDEQERQKEEDSEKLVKDKYAALGSFYSCEEWFTGEGPV
ncbi:hypothetical protein Taro_053976, partial [Colocasia esculenta]|nr:hypothetical protein [Colocasia esculenta]